VGQSTLLKDTRTVVPVPDVVGHINNRGEKVREETGRARLPSKLESKKDFKTRGTNNSFLVMVYSSLFNNVIEALNLVLDKYLAEIQLPGNITQLLSLTQDSGMACHWRFPLYTV
jgi:hypothetical protein